METSTGVTPLYVTPGPGSLRIGLLLSGPAVTTWMARIIAGIQASGFAGIDFIALISGEESTDLAHTLYRGYARHEAAHRRGIDSPFATVDFAHALGEIPRLELSADRHNGAWTPTKESLGQIRARSPDVVLLFGATQGISPDLLAIPRHGVWTLAVGDAPVDSQGPGLFWEMHRGNPVASTSLWRLRPDDKVDVLYSSFGPSHPHSLELAGRAAARKVSNFVMRALRELAEKGEVKPRETLSLVTRHAVPGNWTMSRFLVRTLKRRARALIDNRAGIQHWSIAWRKSPLMDPASPDIDGMQLLKCPRGHFYADPFLFRHMSQDWLFFEDLDYSTGKGGIAAMPFSDEGPAGPARTVLRLPAHLSYPFVFEWNEQIYMMPEIGDTGGPVRLFRACRFPNEWEFTCELISGHAAVDATLHEHEGRWYLFANICETPGGSENDELFLFHAETPLGPFLPHPQNPIVSDVRCARPAGRLYFNGNRLVRPSQDCAVSYGRALVFNEVLELSPLRYSERRLGRLAPGPGRGFVGCHTYAALGNLEVVDLKHQRFRLAVGA